ncbi:hypothetical protein OBBRIDRAFT_787058 [Obba rivulosa]|uniref:Uncharacterized protein n=1 Tax=Obba rivulosa TaxID=1052685 RepID=A0A8E2DUZ7_9APHY|nr:hypothetical protein OBBRIDRAFT_787058 [Obba rivulosa]
MSDASLITLQVTQTWRGHGANYQVLPLHWAITFRTGGTDDQPKGTLYNVAGNIDTYCFEKLTDVPIKTHLWRGALTVGTIPKSNLPKMEQLLAQTPVVRHDPNWNCQNWVWISLRELRQKRELNINIDPELSWQILCAKMSRLLDDWENGDI